MIIGIDPGVKKCAVAVSRGVIDATYLCTPAELLDFIEHNWSVSTEVESVTIEQPVAQGIRSARNSTFELVRIADRIVQACVKAGLKTYAVPVQVIREQAGIARNSRKQDAAVKAYLQRALNLCDDAFKRGKWLANADRRDAMMCALFNWKDARNQVYAQTGEGGQ